jgi:hypothetical protein
MKEAEGPSSESAPSRVLAKNGTVDAAVAVVLFILGAVVIVQARALGAEWTSDGPGSGYFPFYIGLILCIASAGILYQALATKSRDTGAFVDREQFVRVLSVLVPAIVYVFFIIFIGIYIASAIYIAAFMIVLGKYRAWKAAFIGVVVSAVFFAMFEIWFKVPLYKGTLDPLAFLGY